MPNFGPVTNSPFDDYIAPEVDKGDNSNVSLQGGDPGYKKQTPPSANIPMATSRHSNMDGGKSINNTDSQSPDAVVKRVS